MTVDVARLQNMFGGTDRTGFRAARPYDDQDNPLKDVDPQQLFAGLQSGDTLAPVADEYGNSLPVSPQIDVTQKDTPDSQTTTEQVVDQPTDPMANREPYRYANKNQILTDAETNYQNAINAPTAKSKKWKSVLAVAAEIANNITNPNHPLKIQGWGGVKHDRAVSDALEKLQPLEQLNKMQRDRAAQEANTNWVNQRPNIEQGKDATKLTIAGMTNATRRASIQAVTDRMIHREDVKSGEADPYINGKGQLALRFKNVDSQGNRKPDELQLDQDNKPIVIGGEESIQWTDPNTGKTFTLKSKQAANAETNAGRLGETITNDTKTYNLKKESQDALNTARTFVNNLRAQELDLRRQQAQVTDAKSAAELAGKAAELANKTATLKQTWATKIGKGGFTQEMFDEMFPPE